MSVIASNPYLLFTDMLVRSSSISLNKEDVEYVSFAMMSSIVSSTFVIERGTFLLSRYTLKKTFRIPLSNLSITVF